MEEVTSRLSQRGWVKAHETSQVRLECPWPSMCLGTGNKVCKGPAAYGSTGHLGNLHFGRWQSAISWGCLPWIVPDWCLFPIWPAAEIHQPSFAGLLNALSKALAVFASIFFFFCLTLKMQLLSSIVKMTVEGDLYALFPMGYDKFCWMSWLLSDKW